MTDRSPVIVLSRQKPHMLLLLILGILTGVSIFAGTYDPNAMERDLPEWVVQIWGGCLLGSGVIAIFGHLGWRRNRMRGMLIERGALLIQAGMVLLYGTVLVGMFGWAATLSGGATLCWAGAHIWESQLIKRDLRMLARMQ